MEGISPQVLLLIGVIGLCGVALAVFKFKAAMLIFGGMLMASALAAPADWQGRPIQTWLLPIQARRSEIFAAGGALLLVSMIFHLSQVKISRITAQGILFICIGFYGAFVRAVGGDLSSGAESFAFAFLTLVPAVIVLPSLFHDKEDAIKFLRIIGLVSIAWIAACAVQFVVRWKVLVVSGGYTRFNGMLANPQHAGAFLAFCVTTTAFLMLNDTKARYRPIWACVAAVNMVLVLWTGSRTGLGMSAIGLASAFYSRIGRSIILLPIAGIVLVAAMSVIQGTGTFNVERLTSTQDTRTRAWAVLWEEFLERPMFGTAMAEQTSFSENSLLMALAGFGIGMGLIVLAQILLMLFKSIIIYKARFSLHDPDEKRLADLVVGFAGMYLFGAMLEGYMISRVSAPLAFLLISSGLGAWLERRARDERAIDRELLELDPAQLEQDDLSEYGDFSDYGGPGDTGRHDALTDSRVA
ncbi:MAG: hypothetical protein JNK58_04805 [Phycisphaerae bacterium]|nr:hypothetical protein [Phycisphaerae bacterium]